MQRIFLSLTFAIATFWVGQGVLHAQPKKTGTKEQKTNVEDVNFEDDKLLSSNLAPDQGKISARGGPIRTILVRPRVSFVPELLKSIENL